VRLGRGLSALLGGDYGVVTDGDIIAPAAANEPLSPSELPISLIDANGRQPRRAFDELEIAELAESIRAKGVLQPILVRPSPEAAGRYEIIAGERRWRAARLAGLESLPAVVRELDDRESLEIAIIENVQRADLNPMEEADAYRALMDRFARTQESVAQQVGKSREHIANTLRLLNLPESVREHVRAGRLTAGHARALLKTADPEAAAAEVIRRGLSVRDAEALARRDRPADPAAAPKPVEEKDIDTRALEHDLSRALGLEVEVKHVKGKGGELRIRFRQLEQLDEICRLLTRPR
jgi:ParB family chromosome partitioning protein